MTVHLRRPPEGSCNCRRDAEGPPSNVPRKQVAVLTPDAIEADYRDYLLKRLESVRELLLEGLDEYLTGRRRDFNRRHREAQRGDGRRQDGTEREDVEALERTIAGLKVQWGKKWTEEDTRERVDETANQVDSFNEQQNRRVIKSITGLDVDNIGGFKADTSKVLQQFSQRSMGLITGPAGIDNQAFQDTREHLVDAVRKGVRHEAFADIVQDRLGVAESRARLIARDQVQKLNSQLSAARQRSIGIERYRWSTAGDERVRESHAAKAGEVFRWDDPPSDTGHPGQDIQCRCSAIPLASDELEPEAEPDKENEPEGVDPDELEQQAEADEEGEPEGAEPEQPELDVPELAEVKDISEVMGNDGRWERHKKAVRNLSAGRREQYRRLAEPFKSSLSETDKRLELRGFLRDIEPSEQELADWVAEEGPDMLGDLTERQIVEEMVREGHLDPFIDPDSNSIQGILNDLDRVSDKKRWKRRVAPKFFEQIERQWNRQLGERHPDPVKGAILKHERGFGGDVEGEFVTTDDVERIVADELDNVREIVEPATLEGYDDFAVKSSISRLTTFEDDFPDSVESVEELDEMHRQLLLEEVANSMHSDGNRDIVAKMRSLRGDLMDEDGDFPIPFKIEGAADPDVVEDGLENFSRIIDDSLLPPVSGQGVDPLGFTRFKGRPRAFHLGESNIINTGTHIREHTVWHELTHSVDYHNERVDEAAKRFLLDRAEGDALEEINHGTDRLEVAWTSDFSDTYTGKVYGDITPDTTGSTLQGVDADMPEASQDLVGDIDETEIMTMGVEAFEDAENMAELYQEDPEHFALTLATLKGRFGFRANKPAEEMQ